MSYYHELYVVCDECHTSLLVDEATYEDADNDAAGSGRRTSSNVRDGGSIATIRVTASVPNAPNLPDGELQLVRS